MSLLARWAGRAIKLTDGGFWKGYFGLGSDSGEQVTIDRALQLDAAWACIKLLSETVGTLPLMVYERGEAGDTAAVNHPLYELLHYQPNMDDTAVEFWEGVVLSLMLYGNAYAEKRMNGGRLTALIPLDACTVKVERNERNERVYHVSDEGKVRKITEDRIFHVRGLRLPGCDLGLSPVAYARQTLGNAIAAEKTAGKMFAGGLQVAGVLSTEQFLKPEQRKELQTILERYAGSDKVGKIMVLEGGQEYKQLSLNPEDAQMLQTRQFSIEQICRWFGVPPIMIGHAAQGQTMWGCLTGDARVFTEAGPKPIKDVQVGENVWSHVDGRMELRRVLRSGQTGVKPVLTVKTRDRSIKATPNHEFFVRRKFPAPRPGVGGYRCVEWRNVWVRAADLTDGDYLILAHDLPHDGVQRAPNGRALTEDFMGFCGLYIAEGSMTSKALCVARADDAPYMNPYRAAMRESFENARGESVLVREQVRSTAISSVSAVREMNELGFAGTAKTKRVPGWVFGLSKPLILAFLRGYLDGDGTVDRRGWITWTSVNRDLIEDIRHLCILAGIPVGEACGYPLTYGFGDRPRTEPGTVWQAWSFSVTHNRLIGTHDPRYVERLANAAVTTKVGRFDPAFVGRGKGGARAGVGFSIDGAVLSKVTAIESASSLAVPVYDIEVDEAHNFIANGIVVHNSGVEQLVLQFAKTGLRPILRRIEAAVRRDILTTEQRGRLKCEFNMEGLLRGDSASRAQFYSTMAQNGILTRNEIRKLENRPPREGGDALTAQTNLAPLAQLGEANRGGRIEGGLSALVEASVEKALKSTPPQTR